MNGVGGQGGDDARERAMKAAEERAKAVRPVRLPPSTTFSLSSAQVDYAAFLI